MLKKYVDLFGKKIEDYLWRHNNDIYFDKWNSKLIGTNKKENFNPEDEVIFPRGTDLASKKVKLEEFQHNHS